MGFGAFMGGLLGKNKTEAPEVETVGTNLYHINSPAFRGEVLESELPVVVYFFSKMCGPCRKMSSVIGNLAGEYNGMVKFISIDAGHARDIVRDYKIRGVPTLVFFKDGKAVDRMLGFKEEDRVKGFIGHIFGITL